jgi:hypothetical protein
MAALDFPASPTVGQIYTANGRSWKWDGVSWISANQITSIGVTGSTLTIYGSPIAHPDATSMTFANSVTLTAASTKTLTLNGGAGSNGLVIDASNNVGIGIVPVDKVSILTAQGINTFANSMMTYGANTGWPAGFANIYDANYVDQFVLINARMTGGTRASPAFTTPTSGGIGLKTSGQTGGLAFLTIPAGSSQVGTQAMTLDASGRLGIGTVSPTARLHVSSGDAQLALFYGNNANNYLQLSDNNGTSVCTVGSISGGNWYLYTAGYGAFYTGLAERARIDSSGNLLVGTTTSTARLTTFSPGAEGTVEVSFLNGGCQFFVNSQGGGNAASTVQRIGRISTTLRSINAGGTINASGADYAEYMTKAGAFEIAKGDICGIDSSGLLTNVFADAIAFVVKSTNPSYVGGDSWGADIEDKDVLEIERQKVDRIAFSGQVPINVFSANTGDYIIPIVDKEGIKGEAVSNPTFEQYQIAVGKVIAIEADGRARIIVKVA